MRQPPPPNWYQYPPQQAPYPPQKRGKKAKQNKSTKQPKTNQSWEQFKSLLAAVLLVIIGVILGGLL